LKEPSQMPTDDLLLDPLQKSSQEPSRIPSVFIPSNLQHLLELERNAVRMNVQWQPAVPTQLPSPEDPPPNYVVSRASNDRRYRQLVFISGVLVLATIAVVAVTTLMIATLKPNGSTTTTTTPSASLKCFDSLEELQGAVDRFVDSNLINFKELNKTYGLPIGTWCVSRVTNFSQPLHRPLHPPILQPIHSSNTRIALEGGKSCDPLRAVQGGN